MTTSAHRLLVVDDDAANRDILSRRLAGAGYPVATTASGREALSYLSSNPVSAVLLDVDMPEMNGFEVLKTIRETRSATTLPVLMVTATNTSDDIVAALEVGANDYIIKPFDFPVVLARIQTQLSLKDSEDRLRASEERYALAAQGSNDGLWDWDLVAHELFLSARWKEIVGDEESKLATGLDEWFGRIHEDDLPQFRRELDAHLEGRTPHFESEHRMRHASGTFRWVLTRGLAVRDGNGRVTRMAGSQSDITKGKVSDALTGLPNRLLLIDRIERMLRRQRRRPSGHVALLFLDLDGFKLVNDSLGHRSGDELLQLVARRIQKSLRPSDLVTRPGRGELLAEHTLARLGGDEFVILLSDLGRAAEATRIADRVHAALRRPFQVGGREVFITASIGIAINIDGNGAPDALLRDADTAMYRAKTLGKGRSELFDSVMREELTAQLQRETAVRLGVERCEFLPYFQPIVDLRTGLLTGFEALMRWRHPTRGILSPAEFLPVLEDNGLVVAVGEQFLRDVIPHARMWNDARPDGSHMSVNVNFSAQQFSAPRIVETLLDALDEAGLPPERLVIEITESTAIADFLNTGQVLRQMREAGLRVELDHFGTGYSSLSCLHELPLTGIKLDQSFIRGSNRHPAILPALIGLAQQLDLEVTAEGVETVDQREHLHTLGCRLAQGNLFGLPLAAEAAEALVREPPTAVMHRT